MQHAAVLEQCRSGRGKPPCISKRQNCGNVRAAKMHISKKVTGEMYVCSEHFKQDDYFWSHLDKPLFFFAHGSVLMLTLFGGAVAFQKMGAEHPVFHG